MHFRWYSVVGVYCKECRAHYSKYDDVVMRFSVNTAECNIPSSMLCIVTLTRKEQYSKYVVVMAAENIGKNNQLPHGYFSIYWEG